MQKRGQRREAWAAARVVYRVLRRPFLQAETREWASQRREQLATLHLRACECLAESYILNDEASIAVDVVGQAVAAQACRETAYQWLIRAHAAAGNRVEALRVYEDCRRLISDHFGVMPSDDTEGVYLGILCSRSQADGGARPVAHRSAPPRWVVGVAQPGPLDDRRSAATVRAGPRRATIASSIFLESDP